MPSAFPSPHSVSTVPCHPTGPLWERPLLEVRLGELHSWISTCSFSPQGLLGAVQRGENSWLWGQVHPTFPWFTLLVPVASLDLDKAQIMEWFGREHKDDPVPSPAWAGTTFPLSQVAPNPIQPSLGDSRDPGAATIGLASPPSPGTILSHLSSQHPSYSLWHWE